MAGGDLVYFLVISIHALREEGDQTRRGDIGGLIDFYPRPPRGGRRRSMTALQWWRNFYPRPPRGGRHRVVWGDERRRGFLSTPSARRATPLNRRTIMQQVNFYPRPPRGGRLGRAERTNHARAISIHALREEGDQLFGVGCGLLWNFYPRPPRGGRRPSRSFLPGCRYFYPRPPRGGRPNKIIYFSLTDNFYPRPPRGGRHLSDTRLSIRSNFYPRPPRGGRRYWCKYKRVPYLFLSTPSARRATHSAQSGQRGGGDFYPRPPRGGRLAVLGKAFNFGVFLSTPSARRATGRYQVRQRHFEFLSTPSARRATVLESSGITPQFISIHALREEGDQDQPEQDKPPQISIHALREEGDRAVS